MRVELNLETATFPRLWVSVASVHRGRRLPFQASDEIGAVAQEMLEPYPLDAGDEFEYGRRDPRQPRTIARLSAGRGG
jgi:hypothetical protein